MNPSSFKKLSGFVDYDRQDLHKLTKKQEIRYFEKRISLVLIKPFRKMYRSLMREKRYDSILCFTTCICCAIEALGRFHSGDLDRNKSGHNFEEFVKEYMNKKGFFQVHNNEPYVKLLWKNFRNGLAHGFAIKNGGFEINEQQPEYFCIKQVGGVNQLMIDPKLFYEDFVQGVERYIDALKKATSNDPILNKFHHAFSGIFILGL